MGFPQFGNVAKINLPPLKKRLEDIPLLVAHFIKQFSTQQGKIIADISSSALNILMRYDYPGNIRELENIIEHAFVLCLEGNINLQHLPDFLYPGSSPVVFEDEDPVKTARIKQIHDALIRNNFNRNAAAKELGIHKSTLFRQIKKFGIKIEEKRSAQ